jgi:PKD repeat protein
MYHKNVLNNTGETTKKNKKSKYVVSILGITIVLSVVAASLIFINNGKINDLFGSIFTGNNPPEVSISANPMSEYKPSNVTFNVFTDDPDGSIKTCIIDFGDGTSSTTESKVYIHSYTDPGSYTVIITITDDKGAIATGNVTIMVKNHKPQAVAYADVYSGKFPLTVNFSGSGYDQDGIIIAYMWNFGDSTTSSIQNTTHTYIKDGTYEAILTVTDDNGDKNTSSIIFSVLANEPPVAVVTYSKVSRFTYKFDASDSNDPDGTIVKYEWDFGDGSRITGIKSTNHLYESAGSYTIKLIVTDNNGITNQDTCSITIEELPSSYSFNPIADASVDSDYPYTNYGDDGTLTVTYWDYVYYDDTYGVAFLKFDLSDIPHGSSISKAELKLFSYYGGDNYENICVFGIRDNSWYENTINFVNNPLDDDELIDCIYAYGDDTWYSWDVTTYVQNHIGEKITLMLLTSTDTGYISFYSKDCSYCDSNELPTLEIELS